MLVYSSLTELENKITQQHILRLNMHFFSMTEFEKMSANEVKRERHVSPGEAQFLWQLIQDHGNNYKVNN